MWCSFTKKQSKFLNLERLKINENSKLLEFVKTEKDKIKQFIKNNKNNLYINITPIDSQILNNDIINSINMAWLDSENFMKELNHLNINILIEWKLTSLVLLSTNKIYIKTISEHYNTFIKKIKLIILIIEYLKDKSNNVQKYINCYLILTKLKKYFPKNNEIIGIKNANSGYSDSSNNVIFIWRYEEYEKVLFHEIIHFLDMDYRNEPINKLENISAMHNYFEAITDFYGICYHLIYLSLITRIKIKSLLEIELSFIKNQAMVVNNLFGLNNWVKIKDKNILIDMNTKKQIKRIKQQASAFSYYIIKYMIFKFALDNYINEYSYSKLFKKILEIGFINEKFVLLKSARMTLLQLK